MCVDVGNMTALVVGNPRLPSTVTEQWGWSDIPHAEQEAAMVAEMLQAKALVGSQVSSFKTQIIVLLFHLYCRLQFASAVAPQSDFIADHD